MAGFVLDNRSASIRPICGLPGAMRLADPLPLPFGVADAAFTPNGDLAIAVTADIPAHLAIVSGLRGSPSVLDLGEIPLGTRVLALSRIGVSALLYTPSSQEIRFASNLFVTPVLSAPLAAGPVSAAALEENGGCAILGSNALRSVCPDGNSRDLRGPGGSITSVLLSATGEDLYFGDSDSRQVLAIRDYRNQSTAAILASDVVQPVALALGKYRQILAADAATLSLILIDTTGVAPPESLPLTVTPTQLRPLPDASLTLVNDLSALPFTLFALTEKRTYFVPAN